MRHVATVPTAPSLTCLISHSLRKSFATLDKDKNVYEQRYVKKPNFSQVHQTRNRRFHRRKRCNILYILRWVTGRITPWSKVLLEKLTITQLVKKFPAFYANRRFVTVLTKPPPPDPILSHMNSANVLTPRLHQIHFNIILIRGRISHVLKFHKQ
jgi:hypothetical protein